MIASRSTHVAEALQPLQTARAFTLAEMLVVVFVIGLLAMVVIPMASSGEGLELERAAYRIKADILYVQSRALTRRVPQSLIFDPNQGFYYCPSDSDASQPAVEPLSRKGYMVLFSLACADEAIMAQSHVDEFPAVDLAEVSFDGETVLYFDSLGLPTTTDGTALSEAAIGILAGGVSRIITLDTASGRVSIE